MVSIWNWFKLLFVRVPLAIVILFLAIVGQGIVRIGRSMSGASLVVGAAADRYVPVRFDWSDRYWQRRRDSERQTRLAQLNERNGVAG